ncbi:MAG: hypothetical protein GY765_32950, partial [bacterium]|nr:hypothetical protein [bacterium]
YDGSSWVEIHIEMGTEYRFYHRGIWGSGSDVFVLGGSYKIENDRLYHQGAGVLNYSGSSWFKKNFGFGCNKDVYSIEGNNGSDVYAMVHDVSDKKTYLAHYDGYRWKAFARIGCRIDSVWGNGGSEVFAVGANGAMLHYNGISWEVLAWDGNLNGVWGSSESDVFAVGDLGSILHYNGTIWSVMLM